MKRIAALLALLLVPSLLPINNARAVDIPVVCADKQNFALRTTNVMVGCLENESSLGEGPIAYSLTAPKKLNETLEVRFKAAQAAAKSEGISLSITSGYRTLNRQTFLFNQAIRKYGSYMAAAKWVAPPEISHHPMGLAMDINYPKDPESVKWLEVNGYKFGLCRTFKNEWWHFEGNIAPGWKCPKMMKDATVLLKS
jgi:LAS superfamily LD-carboxypeptidase LdcB